MDAQENISTGKPKINDLVEEYQKVLQSDPDNLVILSNLGVCYASLNNEEAITIFNKILEQDPKNLDALNNVGVVYTQFGKFEDAITKLEIAVKLDSSKARIWSNLSEVYRRAGNYHKANVCRMRAIQLSEKKKRK